MMTDLHPAATRYLKELDRALADLPRERRREIVEDIRNHIEEGSRDAGGDVHILTLLDELGDPEVIASDALERFGITRTRAGALEGVAISALLVGGVVVPAVGWVVGVVLLWLSRVWSTREKLIGTFLLPGGLALPLYLYLFEPFGITYCETIHQRGGGRRLEETVTGCGTQPLTSEWWGIAIMVLIGLIPIATAIYLGRRAWNAEA